mmetsp:Transcript_6148/g.21614  ORF Transcript_6148/g.21614 Transcript_6148/m.21614 type:complete len:222 (-) Transcript_6148:2738-3403(-)
MIARLPLREPLRGAYRGLQRPRQVHPVRVVAHHLRRPGPRLLRQLRHPNLVVVTIEQRLPQVVLQAHGAALLLPEHAARAPHLQVLLGDEEAAGVALEHGEPLVNLGILCLGLVNGLFIRFPPGPGILFLAFPHQNALPPDFAAAHAAPQLVQRRQPAPHRVADDHERRLGDVHADLHHRRRHEDLRPSLLEITHCSLLFLRILAAVAQPDADAVIAQLFL